MAVRPEHPLRDFASAFDFAFRNGFPVLLVFWVVAGALALLGVHYYALAALSPAALFFALRRLLAARKSLGDTRPVFNDAGARTTLFYALFIGGFSAVFALIDQLSPGYPVTPLANWGSGITAPYLWFEVAFYGVMISLDTGADAHTSFMDSLLFLGAHKHLARQLLLYFWLPLVVAEFVLPGELFLLVATAAFFAGPALIFASFLHPGEPGGGKGRRVTSLHRKPMAGLAPACSSLSSKTSMFCFHRRGN